jgi:hypothetical protein
MKASVAWVIIEVGVIEIDDYSIMYAELPNGKWQWSVSNGAEGTAGIAEDRSTAQSAGINTVKELQRGMA